MRRIPSVVLISAAAVTALILLLGPQPRVIGAAPVTGPFAPQPGVYLPLVRIHNESVPLGIEIAALHQIVTTQNSGLASPVTSRAELLAHIDVVFPSLVAALQDSGASWTRLYIVWSDIEQTAPVSGEAPQYTWDWYDSKLKAIADAGVDIIGTIASPPEWATSPEPQCAPLTVDRQLDFARFAGDLVARYKQPPYNIKHWEIINEPDYTLSDGETRGFGCWGNDGGTYAQMLATVYQAIKAVDSSATVLMGGLGYDAFYEEQDYSFNRYFIDNVMAAGGGSSADGLGIHYYPDWHPEWERWVAGSTQRQNGSLPAPTCGNVSDGIGASYEPWGPDLMAKATHFNLRMQTCYGVNKPLWISELAQHGYSGDPSSLTEQARYVIKGNVRGLAAGAVNIIWYALTTPNDHADQQLLFSDLSPKPGFYAFKTLTSELRGYKYDRPLSLTSGEGYVFRSTAAEKAVAWGSGTLSYVSVTVLRVVDRLGSVTIIQDGGAGDADLSANGRIVVQLSDDPVFIQITG